MKRDSVKKRVSFGEKVGEEANSSKSHFKKAKRVSGTKSSDVSGESSSSTPDIKPKQEKLYEKRGVSSSESDGEDVKKSITKQVTKKVPQVSLPENLELFLQNRPNLTLTTPTKKHPDLKVYSEEEVFILQCHNSIQPEKLLGQKIYLKGRTEIEADGLEFSVEKISQGISKTVTLVSSQERGHLTAETFPVVGKITLSELIEEPIITYNNASQDNSHEEFPANLRVRHPLLGADFENTLSENIVVKQESPEVEVIQPSQKKSKRKRNREESTSPNKSPSKKKIKHEEISSDLQWLQDV